MYRPAAFSVDDGTAVELARAIGFGHLVVAGADGLSATPVPFVLDADGTSVHMHLARPNDVWRAAPAAALLIVPISDAYVSPGWYPSKAEHGKVVPTWNYEVVHAHGALVAHDDPVWVRTQIEALTDRNEAALDPAWAVGDAPDGFVDQLQRGIVGVELVVARWEGKRKLSQNRSDDDRLGAADGMHAADLRGGGVVSRAMRQA